MFSKPSDGLLRRLEGLPCLEKHGRPMSRLLASLQSQQTYTVYFTSTRPPEDLPCPDNFPKMFVKKSFPCLETFPLMIIIFFLKTKIPKEL